MLGLGLDLVAGKQSSGSAPPLWWVYRGALVDADFANGRYWRQDMGACTLADIMPDGTASVVPGIGLTTGNQSTVSGSYSYLSAGAYALVADGCAVALDFDLELVSGSLVNSSSWIHAYVSFYDAGFAQELRATPYISVTGNHVRGEAYTDDPAGQDVGDTIVAGGFTRLAANLDPATGEILVSYEGTTKDGALFTGDYSALDRFLVGCTVEPAGGDTFTGNATIKRWTAYPMKDQAALNRLTR